MPTKAVKKVKRTKTTEPLWKGYLEDGITQSMLGKWRVCRERARLQFVYGLTEVDRFNHRIEYGNMWHVGEEHWLASGSFTVCTERVQEYCKTLAHRYRDQQSKVYHWYRVWEKQFPYYVRYWEKNKDVKRTKPLLQEYTFHVPYVLPSGKTVVLRGKWDAINLVDGKLELQENKTKGDVDPVKMKNQLRFDMQTMFYLTALNYHLHNYDSSKHSLLGKDYGLPTGVRYNVIRRPLSGGRGTIRQKKNQTEEEFYNQLEEYFITEPEYFFSRFKVTTIQKDIREFERRFLVPELETLCLWWDWLGTVNYDPWNVPASKLKPEASGFPAYSLHSQSPYGNYNPLADGGGTELDEYLASGSMLGLAETDTLFPELEV